MEAWIGLVVTILGGTVLAAFQFRLQRRLGTLNQDHQVALAKLREAHEKRMADDDGVGRKEMASLKNELRQVLVSHAHESSHTLLLRTERLKLGVGAVSDAWKSCYAAYRLTKKAIREYGGDGLDPDTLKEAKASIETARNTARSGWPFMSDELQTLATDWVKQCDNAVASVSSDGEQVEIPVQIAELKDLRGKLARRCRKEIDSLFSASPRTEIEAAE